jgi:beta-glucosidase
LEKFRLGLFDQRYVDAAAAVVGRGAFVEASLDAQRASYTLLTNNDDILPLNAGLTVYVEGVDAAVLEQYAKVVSDPAAADVALVRLKAPYEPRPGGFEAHFHAGSLEFPVEEVHRLQALFSTVPTVVDLYLDRPAIVPEICSGCGGAVGQLRQQRTRLCRRGVWAGLAAGAAAVRLALLDAFGRAEPRRAVRHCRPLVPVRRRD